MMMTMTVVAILWLFLLSCPKHVTAFVISKNKNTKNGAMAGHSSSLDGYVPSGLTRQEYETLKAQEHATAMAQQNLGAWGPRFQRGEMPDGDWMVDTNLWIDGFNEQKKQQEQEEEEEEEDIPPRAVAFTSPPGKTGSLVTEQEAMDWMDYHADLWPTTTTTTYHHDSHNEEQQHEDTTDEPARRPANIRVAIVDLSQRTWSPQAITVLQANLTSIAHQVETLDLAGTTKGLSTQDAAHVMSILAQIFSTHTTNTHGSSGSTMSLKNVDFSQNDLSSDLAAQSAGAILATCVSQWERIYLLDCNLQQGSDESHQGGESSFLWRAFQQQQKQQQQQTEYPLQELIVNDNPNAGTIMALNVANILQHCPQMRVLDYSNNNPGKQGSKAIVDAFHHHHHHRHESTHSPLRVLRLNHLDASNHVIQSLAMALERAPDLQHLSLRDSASSAAYHHHDGDTANDNQKHSDSNQQAARALIQALVQSNCPLAHLDLVGSDLQFGHEETCQLIQQLFRQTAPFLKCLKADLHELVAMSNDQYGEGGIRVLLAPFEENHHHHQHHRENGSPIMTWGALQELELEHVSKQCLHDLLHSRLPRNQLSSLSLFGDNDVRQLELYDKVDWRRRLSVKYPAAEVTLQDGR